MLLTLVLEDASGLVAATPGRLEFGPRDALSIGRAASADWQLADAERLISGLHCDIRREGRDFVVHDLSSNGTFVNGAARRLSGPHRLRDGDTLRLGACVIRAALREDAADPDATQLLQPGGETLSRVDAQALRLVLTPETARAQAGPAGIDLHRDRHLRIGRDASAHWRLSDGSGRISRIHCEIRFEDGGFHLHDVSRNGTFLAGETGRLGGAHRLRAGDRFEVGEFVIDVVAPGTAGDHRAPAMPLRRGGDPAAMISQTAAASEATQLTPPGAQAPLQPGAAGAAVDPLLLALATGLGLAPAELAERDAAVLCEEAGALLRLVCWELARLLAERAEHEVVQGRATRDRLREQGNNPLERLPPDEAIRALFGPPQRPWLDSRRSLQVAFERLHRHFIALDRAAAEAPHEILSLLAPEAIADAAPRAGALSRLAYAGKPALWDEFVRRWSAASAGTIR